MSEKIDYKSWDELCEEKLSQGIKKESNHFYEYYCQYDDFHSSIADLMIPKKEGVSFDDGIISQDFPVLRKDGGFIKDLDMMRKFLQDPYVKEKMEMNISILLNHGHNLEDTNLSKSQIDRIKTAIKTYAEASNSHIYKQVLKRNNWK